MLRRNLRMSALGLLCLPLLAGTSPATSRLDVSLDGLRNAKGLVRVCLTRDPKRFPDCEADPHALSRTLPAAKAKQFSFVNVAPGTYALALFHDENANAKLDTMLAIPREGFGFSRNPTIRFGAPKFQQVAFPISAAKAQVTVRMQYFL